MKIGINASFARKPTTGIGQVTVNFLRKLADFSDAEFVLYLEEDLPKKFKLPKNFSKNIFLPVWKRDDLIRKIWWEKFMLPQKARKDGCDVFLSLYQCPTVFGGETKHVMLVHDIIPALFPGYLNNCRKKIYQKMTEKAIKRADRIMAVSKRTEKDLIGHLGVPGEKIAVNYIDVDEIFKSEVSTERNRKVLSKYRLKPGYILGGGGLEVRKNVEGTIRAYKALMDKNKSEHFIHELPKLVIYGKLLPELAPLVTDGEKMAREMNMTKYIKFLGVVPQEHMPALFSNAVMFVYPSYYEGFGMPPLEAMNQGTPTIISKSSSLPEVGGDGVLYCNEDDIPEIALVMRNILTNSSLRNDLEKKARERAKKFSWDSFARKFFHIVESLN